MSSADRVRGGYWARRQRPILLPILVGLVGLLGIGLAQGVPNRHSIEDDLTRRSAAALSAAGLSGVEVSFTGRDGSLRVPSAADRDRALEVVRAVEGVRVASATSPDGEQPVTRLPTVTLKVDAGKTVLTGTVPSDAARSALVDSAAAVFGAGNVQDSLTVDAGVSDAALAGLGPVLRALGTGATGAAVELRDGRVTLTGTVPSQAIRDAAVRAAGEAVGGTASVVDQLQVSAPPPETVEKELAELPPITFESGSATLTPQGRASVTRAAAILRANPQVRVRIEGHTDGNGTAAANLTLSRARAQTVLTTLRSLGIAANRLTSVGFGESRPKVPDTSPANQAINRRVEFIVVA